MDELFEKTEALLKSLLSVKTNASKALMVPALKPPTMKVAKPSIKQPSAGKIPSGLPPPSKKDPVKVAEQLKNPQPGKVKTEILKVEGNGQWSLTKGTSDHTPILGQVTPERHAQIAANRAPINAKTEGFANHSHAQENLIHGLDLHSAKPMRGSAAGAATRAKTNNGKEVILKKASSHQNAKERGHLNNGLNSAKREVLFHNMANDVFGMGHHVPTTSGFSRNGEDYSAQEMKNNATHADFKKDPAASLDDFSEGENPFEAPQKEGEFADPSHAETLKKLHGSGELHKLALMDNIMGHHDRHGGNYMMEKGNKLHLIDNGTAFDYGNFDTTHYPKYLEHSEDPNIKGMGLDNSKLHPEAAKWLNSIDPEKAKQVMAQHGQDEHSPAAQGFLRRLQGMKNAVNNGPEHYGNVSNLLDKNRLTTGPIYQHRPIEAKW